MVHFSRKFLNDDDGVTTQKEATDFPEVPDNHFNIVDEKEIEEMQAKIIENSKMRSKTFAVRGTQVAVEAGQFCKESEGFNAKSAGLLSCLDACKKKLDNDKSSSFTEQKFIYYNMEDVVYKEKDSIQEAFAFLRDLEKQQQQQQKSTDPSSDMLEEEFDHLTFKPSYSKKGNSLKLEKIEAEEQAQDTVHRKLMHLTLEDDLDV